MTSPSFDLQVTASSGIPTSLSLSTNVPSAVYGTPVTLTAAVTGGASVPSGTVTFSSDGVVVAASVPVDSSGHASTTTSLLGVGSRALVAAYAPNDTHLSSVGLTSCTR